MTFTARMCKRFLERPIMNTIPKRYRIDHQLLCPRRQRLSLTVKGNHNIVAAVSSLLLCSSPTQIIWRIWAIVVNTFKRKPIRASHYQEKVRKCTDSWVYENAATPISGIITAFRIFATINHRCPDTVFPRGRPFIFSTSAFAVYCLCHVHSIHVIQRLG